MANASAKKASAARSAAASTYRPLVVGINIVHFLIRLYQYSVSGNTTLLSTTSLAIHVLLLVLTGIAYRGILDDYAASATSTSKITGSSIGSSGSSGSSSGSKNKLAGGASLDLLGLIVIIQYGSALISDAFYWLLGILPLWGAVRLYKTVTGAKDGLMGGGGGGSGVQNSGGTGSAGHYGVSGGGGNNDAAEERRRKRAERRRMKRG
mmetsp:Transcript_29745/g.65480  ORF Transcript_29745/g.65480 Transcript_29745/m.65480 type:complete len:208 (+) Transcript_29745:215-838(+)